MEEDLDFGTATIKWPMAGDDLFQGGRNGRIVMITLQLIGRRAIHW